MRSAQISGLFLGAGVLIGWLSWGISSALMPVTIFFALLYGLTRTRLHALLLAAGYYLAATRGLILGTAEFFGSNMSVGLVLWLLGSLSFILVYTLCWRENKGKRAIGFIAAMTLMSVPPFGIVGWVSPLTSAGILFPESGLLGIVLMAVLFFSLTQVKARAAQVTIAALALICLTLNLSVSSSVCLTSKMCLTTKAAADAKPDMENWQSAQTNVRYNSSRNDIESVLLMQLAANELVPMVTTDNVLFPESAVGSFQINKDIWQSYADENNRVIYAGASEKVGKQTYNAIARFAPDEAAKIVYRQRMPVPVSMWRPWSRDGTRAKFFGNAAYEDLDNTIGFLICYEQLLVWPYIDSHIAGANGYVGIANDWWAVNTTIPKIQEHSMLAWSRLFGVKFELSMNL